MSEKRDLHEIDTMVKVLHTITETIEMIPNRNMTLTQRIALNEIDNDVRSLTESFSAAKSKEHRNKVKEDLKLLISKMEKLKRGFCNA